MLALAEEIGLLTNRGNQGVILVGLSLLLLMVVACAVLRINLWAFLPWTWANPSYDEPIESVFGATREKLK
jgi:hypothetical protein